MQAPKRRDTKSGGVGSVPRWALVLIALVVAGVVVAVVVAMSGGSGGSSASNEVKSAMTAAGCTVKDVKPYGLVSAERVSSRSWSYQLLNIGGAIGLVINSTWNGAIPSAVVNLIWIGIGVYALVAGRLAVRARVPPPRKASVSEPR